MKTPLLRTIAAASTIAFIAALTVCIPVSRAQTTAPTTSASDQAGPLKIHVTAVQGQAQFRPDANTKWATITADTDLPEGVELRTGPKGTIQFTVGSDQVYRIDRLTVVKVLRANLNEDGTIRTDVGMTYGRVSKDVDLPQHPHQDTIISPSSTLAVRGTHVGYYDQPPFAPEATSLTGTAFFRNLHGELIAFGGKGTGFAKVNGDSSNAGQFNLNNNFVDPNGGFAGHTAVDQQTLINALGGLQGTQLGVFQGLSGTTGGTPFTSIVGALPVPGELFFTMFWTSTTPNTQVDFSVKSPLGELVDITHQSAKSGGSFNTSQGQSNIANQGSSSFFSFQEVDWGAINTMYPNGNYTLTTTFQGTNNGTLTPLAPNSTSTVNLSSIQAVQTPPENSGQFTTVTFAPNQVTLSAANPTEQFVVGVPIANNEAIVEIDSHGHHTVVSSGVGNPSPNVRTKSPK